MDKWLRDNLVCPRHKMRVAPQGDYLVCPENDRYLVVDGIPVMIYDDGTPTHHYIRQTLNKVARIEKGEAIENVVGTYGLNEFGVDKYVGLNLPYTCGNLYFAIQDNLSRYPFPEFRLPRGDGQRLLDIGCGWGRWTVPAQQKGYLAVGIDPNLDSVLAARRIGKQCGAEPSFVVADAMSLPFADGCVDVTFSYSILQHFLKSNVRRALAEAARVTRPDGLACIQMANKYGLRSLYHQIRKGFKPGQQGIDVFYWGPKELIEEFRDKFGNAEMAVDCFFGLNLQKADLELMPFSHRVFIQTSELFRSLSEKIPQLAKFADSLYLSSRNQKTNRQG